MSFCLLINYIDSLAVTYMISSLMGLFSFVINLTILIRYLKKQDNKFGI